MSLHLLKLCVGIDSTDHLKSRINQRLSTQRTLGQKLEIFHTTRMIPKRSDELINGGSLYWVIKGVIQARQQILDIKPFKDVDGISRCNVILSEALILTNSMPKRAFQGWRYLIAEDAPEDLAEGYTNSEINPTMQANLRELCLL